MSISGGSLSSTSSPALGSGASVPLCTVPPGAATVLLSNNSGATVYVTAGSAATTTNGFAIPTGAPPVAFPVYPGSKGAVLNVIAGTAPTAGAPVSWMISSAQ